MSYAPAAPMNRSAVVSLVLGIIGGILPLIGSIIGVVFGHKALRQIRVSAERGRVLAIVGLILNYLAIVTYIGLGALLIVLALGIGGFNSLNNNGGTTGANGTRDVSNTQTYSECAAAAGSDSKAMAQCVARFRTIEPSATTQVG